MYEPTSINKVHSTIPTLTEAVTAKLPPATALLSATLGKLVVTLNRSKVALFRNENLAALFLNPYTRREVYKEAHTDPALATHIIAADPFYATRSQLTPLQKKIRFTSEKILFVPLAGVEGIIGGPIDVIEAKFFKSRRTLIGRIYDDVMYLFSDMFHGKRLLYTLDAAPANGDSK